MLRLADRGEGAEHHRGDREEDDDLLPFAVDGGEGGDSDAHDQRHRGDFGAAAKKAVTGVGAPS